MVKLDWSVAQHCTDCKRPMVSQKQPPRDGHIMYGGRGFCTTCIKNHPNTSQKPAFRDWSVDHHCLECGRKMSKVYVAGSGIPSHHSGGVCIYCRSKAARAAQGVTARYAHTFDDNGITCLHCDEYKPFSEFTPMKTNLSGYSGYCRRCTSLRNHNVSIELYRALVASGQYLCGICDKTEEENGRALDIDHNHSCCPGVHSCGRCFRGFLCSKCNTGVGMFKDSVEILDRAKTYLLKAQLADLT